MLKNQPLQILLVEDDPAHAEIVIRSLADFHVPNRLTHVSDGQAAIDYLITQGGSPPLNSGGQPDVILLDLRLPKVDGLGVLAFLKGHPQFKIIPTVILTTSGAERDMLEAYKCGANGYLVKPVGFESFTKLMGSFGGFWLGSNSYPNRLTARPG